MKESGDDFWRVFGKEDGVGQAVPAFRDCKAADVLLEKGDRQGFDDLEPYLNWQIRR